MAPSVKCTYETCDQHFEDEKQMKKHKYDTREHVYCRRCDYDAKDWEDLLRHKTDAMAPYLYGTLKLEREDKKNGKKIMHVVCEFCGEDFHTWTGREKHRNMYHQATQEIVCKGSGAVFDTMTGEHAVRQCHQIFNRPSDLIAHYEEGDCLFISSRDFKLERQRKHVVKQILQDPDHFSNFLKQCKGTKETDADDEELEWNDRGQAWGGAQLQNFLESEDPLQDTAGVPLQPRVNPLNLMDADFPMSRATQETWPRTPDYDMESMQTKFRDLNVSPPSSKKTSSTNFRKASVQDDDDDDNASMDVDGASSPGHKQTAPSPIAEWPPRDPWQRTALLDAFMATPPASPGAKAASRSHASTTSNNTAKDGTINWAAIAKSHAYTEQIDAQTNLFHAHWWDSSSPTYDSNLFYHVLLEKYKCPFPGCQGEFEDSIQLGNHLQTYHTLPAIKCSLCLKKFAKVSALMSHFESSEKGSGCKIAKSRDYGLVLDEVTGGFLAVEKMVGEKCVGYATRGQGENRVVVRFGEEKRSEKRNAGVHKAKYETREAEKKTGGGVRW